MRRLLRIVAPALTLAFTLSPSGAGDAPPHLASALAQQRALTQSRPSDAGVWNDLGNLLALNGDLDDAAAAYARALELDSTSVTTRFNLGLLREQSGDLEGAADDYRALLEVEPGHAWAHYRLGVIHHRSGQRQEALAHYAEAFTLDPELLFPETNPHVIENRLVTEALLHARRGSRSGPPAPRAYDEPGRIKSLLAPAPIPSELGAEKLERPAADEALEDGEGGEEEEGREENPPGSHPPPAFPPAEGRIDRKIGERPGARVVAPGDRVLDSTDLRGGVRNQVQGGDQGLPVAPGTRGRAAATVAPGRPPLHQPPDPRAPITLIPGLRSTGSLEWHLGPASDQPVPAR